MTDELEWVCNYRESQDLAIRRWADCFIKGDPKATRGEDVADLERTGLCGLYRRKEGGE